MRLGDWKEQLKEYRTMTWHGTHWFSVLQHVVSPASFGFSVLYKLIWFLLGLI